jgi:hypothetical protein
MKITMTKLMVFLGVGLFVGACAVAPADDNSDDKTTLGTTQQAVDTGKGPKTETIDCSKTLNEECIECGGKDVGCCRGDNCIGINKPPQPPPPPPPKRISPVAPPPGDLVFTTSP